MSNSIIDVFSKILINDSYGKYSNMVDIPIFESLRTIKINSFDHKAKYKLDIWYGDKYILYCNEIYRYISIKNMLYVLYFNIINHFKRLINKWLSLYKIYYIDAYYKVEGIGTSHIYEPITKFINVIIKNDLEYREKYEKEFLPKYIKTKRLQRTIEKQYESRHNSTTIE